MAIVAESSPVHTPLVLQHGSSILSKSRKARPPRHRDKSVQCRLITTAELSAIRADMDNLVDTLRITIATPILPPFFFTTFSHLRVLDLRKIGLERLPSQIIELRNLQELDLRYNTLTYLPSQIAQIPNLHRLQLQDARNRKNKLLQESNIISEDIALVCGDCPCEINSNGDRIPPLPTLAQTCMRTILTTITSAPTNETEDLTWEDLEPFYNSGKLAEPSSNYILPFPSHLLPPDIPIDLCSTCLEPAFPIHAEFQTSRVVALSRVRLRYVFCSHNCLSTCLQETEKERMDTEAKLARQKRFHIKHHGQNDVEI
jgi:hypothetical protein